MSTPADGSPDELPRHPGRHRGTHAAPPTPFRQLVRSLLAVAVVAALVALLLEWRGSPSSDADANPAAVVAPTTSVTPTVTATPTTEPTPSPSAVRTTRPPRPVKLALTVLNNSTRTGLAARSAAEFEARGWPIREVGNFRGQIATTTVYYTAGNERQRASARLLRKQFPEVGRVHERFEGLPGDGLTVVLTADYPA